MVSHAGCAFFPDREQFEFYCHPNRHSKELLGPLWPSTRGRSDEQNTGKSVFDFIKNIKCFTRIQPALCVFFCVHVWLFRQHVLLGATRHFWGQTRYSPEFWWNLTFCCFNINVRWTIKWGMLLHNMRNKLNMRNQPTLNGNFMKMLHSEQMGI